MFSELCDGHLDLERLNYAYVVLIPKQKGAAIVRKFRPISLLNLTIKSSLKF